MKSCFLLVAALLMWNGRVAWAQVTPQETPDVSNKALITQAPPHLDAKITAETAALHKLADEFYAWRNEQFPVRSSDSRPAYLGRSPDRLFAGQNRRAGEAHPGFAREGERDADGRVAEG